MRLLTNAESASWCERRTVPVTIDQRRFFPESIRCITIELPEKPYQLVALANSLLPYTDDASPLGALIWIRLWGIWSKSVENAGLRVLEVMRSLHGDNRPLIEAPGYLFSADEEIDLLICFIQPLLIGWDAFLIPDTGNYIVETSHDETIRVFARTEQIHEQMVAQLKPWGPQEEKNSRVGQR
jgi:hypothetical protein